MSKDFRTHAVGIASLVTLAVMIGLGYVLNSESIADDHFLTVFGLLMFGSLLLFLTLPVILCLAAAKHVIQGSENPQRLARQIKDCVLMIVFVIVYIALCQISSLLPASLDFINVLLHPWVLISGLYILCLVLKLTLQHFFVNDRGSGRIG